MKKVVCDFNKNIGKINPQHGVVNNPWRYLGHPPYALNIAEADMGSYLMNDIGFPMIRVVGRAGRNVDVLNIFHNMSKNPDEFNNYDFISTDRYLEGIANKGCQIMYHLGVQSEYYAPLNTILPKDFEKFASVCLHIVERYNEGWMGGYHFGIKYWEIWHRADDPQCMQGGSFEDYYRLYETVALKIKNKYPNLKVGGPAAAFCGGDNKFLKGFLSYVKKNNVPCDFVSWNYYGDDPNEALNQALAVKKLVEDAKLPNKVEIINDEWQCMKYDENKRFDVKNVRNMHGASFDTAFMINMQKAKMDISTYYSGESNLPWGGLTDYVWLKPNPPLYALFAFSEVYKTKNETYCDATGENVYALCGSDGNKKALVVSVYEDKDNEITIDCGYLGKKTVYMLSNDYMFKPVMETEESKFIVKTEGYTVLYIVNE